MTNCISCGTGLRDGVNACPRCGTLVELASPGASTIVVDGRAKPAAATEKSTSSAVQNKAGSPTSSLMRFWPWLVAIALLLVVVALLALRP